VKLDVEELRAGYRQRLYRPEDVLDTVLESIARRGERPLWISVFSRAELQVQLESSDPGAPLYGIPFAVKDNIDVAGLPTTAACPEFAYRPAKSAFVVERLRKAGAIVIGKTNLDQFATGLVGTRSPYGACGCAFDERYVAGGSSSGSALAVAFGQVSFALGTDTAGSGRVPAAFNGLVGLKPTRGVLSTRGVVPACRSLDCVSIFARAVDDAEAVLRESMAFDAEDAYASEHQPPPALHDGPVRLALPRASDLRFFGDNESEELFAAAIERARTLGFELVEIELGPFFEAAELLYGGPWVAERLAATSEFLNQHARAVHPVVRKIIEAAREYSAESAFKAQYRLRELQRVTARVFQQAEALLLPTTPTHYTIAEVDASPFELNARLGTYTNFTNLLNLSALALPAGHRATGRPFGITLMAPAHHELRLLELGRRWASVRPRTSAPMAGCVWLAVAGAHLTGEPLNHELTERGARRVRTSHTAPEYRLYALETEPPKPGLVRVPGQAGAAIEVEVWELTERAFASFAAALPPPMTIGSLELDDGSTVRGFACEAYALGGARDITQHGGWRAFRAAERVG
jgi:allophanate hydrolase